MNEYLWVGVLFSNALSTVNFAAASGILKAALCYYFFLMITILPCDFGVVN